MGYEAQRTKAYKAIKSKGAAVVLKRTVGGDYDPETCRTAPPMPLSYGTYALIEEYPATNYGTGVTDGSLIIAGDKKFTLGIPDADFPEPAAADVLEVEETAYKVIRCKPLAPGGVAILYEVQARK